MVDMRKTCQVFPQKLPKNKRIDDLLTILIFGLFGEVGGQDLAYHRQVDIVIERG